MTATNRIRTFDASASALAFPLGGIGTGNISLGARGDLRDWEIYNSSAKGTAMPNTFFALRAQVAGQEPITRVLEGPIQPPHNLSHGYHPASNAGLPRLRGTTFRGEYPFASIDFDDADLPVQVRMEAFTPLIPLNADDSGIPCAILTYTLTNPGQEPVDLTLAASIMNSTAGIVYDQFGNIKSTRNGQTVNRYQDDGAFRGLVMSSEGVDALDLAYGNMSLVTDHADVTVKPAWLRGGWFDYLREFWDDFTDDGRLTDLGYTTPGSVPDTGSIGLLDRLEPGEQKSYRFILTWFFPNRLNSWGVTHNSRVDPATTTQTRNHYAVQFDSAWSVARYVIDELPRLEHETRQFHDALFGSTLPASVLDAISANIVPVRSNTCFWLEDGRFMGWEGCFDDAGSCPGTCTHVWSYAQTVAFLFPALEREMRRIEFTVETEPDGYMAFRTFKTFHQTFLWEWANQKPEAAVDGQMGSVLRAYREWQLSGDRDWLSNLWPGIKRAMAYAAEHWDLDGDGVLDGKQHNTYDIEFYGPNPLSSIYYLAALSALAELADVMGESDLAERTRLNVQEYGARLDSLLWNGEYYVQLLADVDEYRYQHGTGCLSDQLMGQLHAFILGLDDFLPPEHVRTAARSIFDHNFRTDFRRHVNCQRTYVLNDESGLIECSWPNGGQPGFPFPYSDEVWTGAEYEVAALLIYSGWLQEGLTVIEATHARHDGIRRNPWDEVECGHHYVRSMSSWAVLLALTGFHADADKGEMSFAPVLDASTEPGLFRTFWSNGRAWGTYECRQNPASGEWEPEIEVIGGETGFSLSQ